mgnify:CR=1 FL=1
MDAFDLLNLQDAVLVFHEFGKEVKHLHESQVGRVRDHKIVADLVIVVDSHSIMIIQNEKLVAMELHKFDQFDSLIFRNQNQFMELLESFFSGQ